MVTKVFQNIFRFLSYGISHLILLTALVGGILLFMYGAFISDIFGKINESIAEAVKMTTENSNKVVNNLLAILEGENGDGLVVNVTSLIDNLEKMKKFIIDNGGSSSLEFPFDVDQIEQMVSMLTNLKTDISTLDTKQIQEIASTIEKFSNQINEINNGYLQPAQEWLKNNYEILSISLIAGSSGFMLVWWIIGIASFVSKKRKKKREKQASSM